MRIIPVLDLLHGQTVHAIKGDRAHYRPVKSMLCDSSDPAAMARAFRDRLGLREIYIADLDAIQGIGNSEHRNAIENLSHREMMNVILDAGVSDAESALRWLDLGVHKIVIGSETLRSLQTLQDIPARIHSDRLIFSLDFRAGNILSQCPAFAAITPFEALERLQQSGWGEIILLHLNRVGSSTGTDFPLAVRALNGFPQMRMLVGGGIAKPEELVELKSAGIAGVLVATALHTGAISAQNIKSLQVEQ